MDNCNQILTGVLTLCMFTNIIYMLLYQHLSFLNCIITIQRETFGIAAITQRMQFVLLRMQKACKLTKENPAVLL